MKRVFGLLLIFYLLISTAYAEDWVKYGIDEMNMEISMPKNYIVFQKDRKASERDLRIVGATEKEIQQRFLDNNIYVTAFDLSGNIIIDIALEKTDNPDLDKMTTNEISSLMNMLVQVDLENGVAVNESRIYRNENMTFIEINEIISEHRRISFFSSKNGIVIHAYALTSEEYYKQIKLEDKMNTLVDNIRFFENDEIWYVDDELNIEFTVPDGWKEMKFDKKDSNFNAKFISKDGKKMKIQYTRIDMWTNIPELKSEGFTRKDINNSLFSEADIAEQYETDIDSVEKKKYGKNEYFICNTQITYPNGKKCAEDTFATTIQNGYIVSFVFSGSEEHELYKDFEKVLESLKVFP